MEKGKLSHDAEAGLAATSLERYGFRLGGRVDLAIDNHWFEFPSQDADKLEIWSYTDQLSYALGEEVAFRSYCSGGTFSLTILRDGAREEIVHRVEGLPGAMPPTPDDVYAKGADWPISYRWTIPADLRSGPYVAVSRTENEQGEVREQHHIFVVRPAAEGPAGDYLLIFASSTWIAYNEWGGANHYQGIAGENEREFSPILSIRRPWARGFVRLPKGAPHAAHDRAVPPGWSVQVPFFNWALGQGYSKWYVGGSYAEYDRHFVQWAEREGYALDYATQHDLHYRPEILDKYRTVILIGHDEYWSSEMRDAIDAFVDRGGQVARFGGNYFWQIRLEGEHQDQVSYKIFAHERDPVRDDPARKHSLTTIWEDRELDRPGVLTLGLNGSRGLYARMGAMAPRHSGGFTVYRPRHWALEGTDLYYGDVFGAEAGIFGFEVDGLAYTFRDGLPYPTGEDGAPVDRIEIIAMAPAVLREDDHGNPLSRVWWRDDDAAVVARCVHGEVTPETLEKVQYGSGMVVSYRRGKGEVFNAGSVIWSFGLTARDFFTEQITRNVLDRFRQPN